MQIAKNIMTRQVEVVNLDTILTEVAEKMRRQNVGILPVVDGKKVRGLISDRDIVVRALAENRDLRQTKASEVMSKDVVFAHEDDSVENAARAMRDHHIRRLVIVDRDNNLIGILSAADLASRARQDLTPETLRDIIGKSSFREEFGMRSFQTMRQNM